MLTRVKINPKLFMGVMRANNRFGTYDNIVFAIRSLLNKMSNQDSRNYAQNTEEYNKNVPIAEDQMPKNELQAEKMFQSGEKSLSNFEKGRLQRIDDILGTHTHFQQTKLYQQRIDSEHIINIQELAKKFKEPARWKLDATNPQLVSNIKIRQRRKYYKAMKKLRSYPLPTQDLTRFEDSNHDEQSNSELMKMLAQQALFTKLSLRQLDLTLESIHNEKLLYQTEDGIIEAELDQQDYIFNGQVYFRPSYSLSMFRMDQKLFSKKMITSIDGMDEYLGKPNSPLQQLFNMEQIYECLQDYYYDERVSELLAKIQNNQLEYFISKMFLSPDARHMCIMIDMLGTKTQYVCLYKFLDPNQNNSFAQENVIFNVRLQMAIRNEGVAYFVQRSESGMYTELMRCKFNQSTPKKQKNQKVEKDKIEKKGSEVVKQLEQQIIYACLPHLELQILQNKQARTEIANGEHLVSSNILIEQYDPLSNKMGNKIFLLQDGVQGLQQVIANADRVLNMIAKQLPQYAHQQKGQDPFYHECYQVIGVGYIVARYHILNKNDSSLALKYGNSNVVSHYVTLVPYEGTDHHRERKLLINQSNALVSSNLPQSISKQEDPLLLENTYQINLTQQNIDFSSLSRLDHSKEQLIYCCPQNQYFTKVTVHTASPTNIYLIFNKSLQSVYDSHTLFIYPLRKNLTPYSIFLDGYPITVQDELSNIGSGRNGILQLKLQSPLLCVNFEYTLWKKQLKQKINQRIFTEIVSIPRIDGDNVSQIKMKIMSSRKFIQNSADNQPIILYIPSSPSQQLDQISLRKLLQKGVILAQPISYRGTFTTDMLNLVRGTKDNWIDCVNDIRSCLKFIKQTLSDRVSIYANGEVMSYLTLLLNIIENQDNSLFDSCVLHEGLYDLTNIPQRVEYFFGNDTKIWEKINPIKMQMVDPSRSRDDEEVEETEQKIKILNLSNILFTSLSKQGKKQGRKLICKLRNHQKIVYDTVFMKEFDWEKQRDLYNLGYLYFIMKKNMQESWKQVQMEKFKNIREEGEAISRDEKDNRKRFQ